MCRAGSSLFWPKGSVLSGPAMGQSYAWKESRPFSTALCAQVNNRVTGKPAVWLAMTQALVCGTTPPVCTHRLLAVCRSGGAAAVGLSSDVDPMCAAASVCVLPRLAGCLAGCLAPCMSCTQVREPSAVVEHEASTSKIGEDQLFYFQSRGVEPEAAVGMIISGFCRQVGGWRGKLVVILAAGWAARCGGCLSVVVCCGGGTGGC